MAIGKIIFSQSCCLARGGSDLHWVPSFCVLLGAAFWHTSLVRVLEMAGSFGQRSWMKSYTGVSQMTLFTLVSPIPSSFPRCFHIKYILYWKRNAAGGALLQLLASGDEAKALRCVNLNSHSIPAPKRTVSLADTEPASFKGEESLEMNLLQGKTNKRSCVILSSKQLLADCCSNTARSLLPTLAPSGCVSSRRRKSGIPKSSISNRNCLSLGFNRQKHCLNQTFFGIYWHY